MKGSSLVSRLIQYFDKGEFTHVALALDDKHVIEADRFKRVSIEHMHYTDYEIVSFPEDAFFLAQNAYSFIGKKYDYLQVLSYAMKRLFRLGVLNNPNALICSELIAEILGREDLKNSTPNELYRALTNQQGARHFI